MSKLAWGKPLLEYATSTDGEPGASASYTKFPTPKKDTTQLNPTDGDETEAQEEGGDVVDSRNEATKYVLEFECFEKKGETNALTDVNGIIAGEFAIRLTPEDTECAGLQIDRCTIRRTISYTAADGIMWHYYCKALKPKAGNTVKVQKIGASK